MSDSHCSSSRHILIRTYINAISIAAYCVLLCPLLFLLQAYKLATRKQTIHRADYNYRG